METFSSLSTRALLRSGGAIIVGFTLGSAFPGRALAQNAPPPAALAELDSFLAVHADGSITIYTSKVDPGTGLMTVFRQTAAEDSAFPWSDSPSSKATPPRRPIMVEQAVVRASRGVRQTFAALPPRHVRRFWTWAQSNSICLRPN